jgi:hypothetical protein
MMQYINRSGIHDLLGAFQYCLAAIMQDTLPFASVIQKFDTIPAAWGCVERIASFGLFAALKKQPLSFLRLSLQYITSHLKKNLLARYLCLSE